MTNMQAAIGLAQVENFHEIINKRRQIELRYAELLEPFDHIEYRKYANWCTGVFWLATVTISGQKNKDEIIERMRAKGVECRSMVNPVHTAPPYRHLKNDHLQVSAEISRNSIHLPSSSDLSEDTISFIIDNLIDSLE